MMSNYDLASYKVRCDNDVDYGLVIGHHDDWSVVVRIENYAFDGVLYVRSNLLEIGRNVDIESTVVQRIFAKDSLLEKVHAHAQLNLSPSSIPIGDVVEVYSSVENCGVDESFSLGEMKEWNVNAGTFRIAPVDVDGAALSHREFDIKEVGVICWRTPRTILYENYRNKDFALAIDTAPFNWVVISFPKDPESRYEGAAMLLASKVMILYEYDIDCGWCGTYLFPVDGVSVSESDPPYRSVLQWDFLRKWYPESTQTPCNINELSWPNILRAFTNDRSMVSVSATDDEFGVYAEVGLLENMDDECIVVRSLSLSGVWEGSEAIPLNSVLCVCIDSPYLAGMEKLVLGARTG